MNSSNAKPEAAADPNTDADTPDACQSLINLTGYRFITLDYLPLLQADMQSALTKTGAMGTVLLAEEGINVALAGDRKATSAARAWFATDARFAGLWLKESFSEVIPFAKLKVRVRREIIAFDNGVTQAAKGRKDAPGLAPKTLKAWLDEGRKVTLLDTRNIYEVEAGTFANATHPDIAHFRDFPQAMQRLQASGDIDPSQPIVTFCTGGIRCEKAAPWLVEQGFDEVYQIDGGILNYFAECGDAHWQGDCFVFDDRVSVDTNLNPTGARLCNGCHRAIPAGTDCGCAEPPV